ncbi:MAG: hypothetical protein PHC28_09530 [Flavobacterium sp.]|nr:hypothetical protein [Flavobacterium sp.]
MYIAVLDEFPDYMTPTLVAHAVLGAHIKFECYPIYNYWLNHSFKKCVVRVNQKEFGKILQLSDIYVGRENKTLDGKDSCIVVCPRIQDDTFPKVLKFAKLWAPNK